MNHGRLTRAIRQEAIGRRQLGPKRPAAPRAPPWLRASSAAGGDVPPGDGSRQLQMPAFGRFCPPHSAPPTRICRLSRESTNSAHFSTGHQRACADRSGHGADITGHHAAAFPPEAQQEASSHGGELLRKRAATRPLLPIAYCLLAIAYASLAIGHSPLSSPLLLPPASAAARIALKQP
jgi:hypothetical protein